MACLRTCASASARHLSWHLLSNDVVFRGLDHQREKEEEEEQEKEEEQPEEKKQKRKKPKEGKAHAPLLKSIGPHLAGGRENGDVRFWDCICHPYRCLILSYFVLSAPNQLPPSLWGGTQLVYYMLSSPRSPASWICVCLCFLSVYVHLHTVSRSDHEQGGKTQHNMALGRNMEEPYKKQAECHRLWQGEVAHTTVLGCLRHLAESVVFDLDQMLLPSHCHWLLSRQHRRDKLRQTTIHANHCKSIPVACSFGGFRDKVCLG